MSSNTEYLLSFELGDKSELLFIHGDPEGLKKLAEVLLTLAENTPEGCFDHEHIWAMEVHKIRHVKVYCWRGSKPYGAPDHPLIQQAKSLADHGYGLAMIKECGASESRMRDARRR
jgi:hypothetical protein